MTAVGYGTGEAHNKPGEGGNKGGAVNDPSKLGVRWQTSQTSAFSYMGKNANLLLASQNPAHRSFSISALTSSVSALASKASLEAATGYEPRVRRQRGKVGTVDLGFPAVGIEVRHPHLVALGLEFLDGDVAERAVERARFGMGEDKQNFHGVSDPMMGN